MTILKILTTLAVIVSIGLAITWILHGVAVGITQTIISMLGTGAIFAVLGISWVIASIIVLARKGA